MSPLHVSDPGVHRRHTAQSRKRAGGVFLTFPALIIVVCTVANLPPVNKRLMGLDAFMHGHNDAIVALLLAAVPFILVALGIFGLVAMYRGRHVAPHANHSSSHHLPHRP